MLIVIIRVSVNAAGTLSALLVTTLTAEARMVCCSFIFRISLSETSHLVLFTSRVYLNTLLLILCIQHLIQDVKNLIQNVCIVDLPLKAHVKSNIISVYT